MLPITSLKLNYQVSDSIISTGLPVLDKLFNRGGIYKGSSILITGIAGTAKTTIASHFTLGACKRKERVIYFSFEESAEQIVRNMAEIGINLRPYLKSNLLHIKSSRPTLQGLEMHLLLIQKAVDELKPQTVVIDPISSLAAVGSGSEVRAMLVRVLDMLKMHQINAIFTTLTHHAEGDYFEATVDAISSLSDTWINLKNEGTQKDVVRSLRIVKSRGMGYVGNHQNFVITDKGIRFLNIDKK